MICSCCGYEIKGKKYPVQNGQKYVCERCWNNLDLFFPEKVQEDERLKILSKMAIETRNQESSIKVRVIRFVQKEIEMYVGKMKVNEILELYEIDRFKEEELEGYQREQYEERTSELVDYLTKCPLAVMPALLVSIRKADFTPLGDDFGITPLGDDFGILSIPRVRGSIWMIDGQHRVGGFSKIRDKFIFSRSLDPSLFPQLMDSAMAAEKVGNKEAHTENTFSSEDIERTIFFIVNKTQRGISPSLKDALLYRIKISGIQGLPIIKKENWRTLAAEIGITLNRDADSPLKDKINIGGRRETGKPIQLNTFVSSLQVLFLDKDFNRLSENDKLRFIKTYWVALKELFPEAFEHKTERNYMLLKALGVYSLHWLAQDILQMCLREDRDLRKPETLKTMLTPLKSFDWFTKTSSLSGLGGLKGASKAHEMLVKSLSENVVSGLQQKLENL